MTHIRIKSQHATAKKTTPKPIFYQYAGTRVVQLARQWCDGHLVSVPGYLDVESLDVHDKALMLADAIKACDFRTRGRTDDPRAIRTEAQANDLVHWLVSYAKFATGQPSDWRYVAEHAAACANGLKAW